jgi:hypothetical protein
MPSLRRNAASTSRPARRKQKFPSRIQVLHAYGSYAFHNALTWQEQAPGRGFSRRVRLTKKTPTGRGFQYAALVSTREPSLLVFERTGGPIRGPRYSPPLDWRALPK